jgi:hypothetical protein
MQQHGPFVGGAPMRGVRPRRADRPRPVKDSGEYVGVAHIQRQQHLNHLSTFTVYGTRGRFVNK